MTFKNRNATGQNLKLFLKPKSIAQINWLISLRNMSQLVKLPFVCGFFPPTLKEHDFIIKHRRKKKKIFIGFGEKHW